MEEDIEKWLQKINNELPLFEKHDLKEHLITYINYLLLHDFNKLIQILYKVDIQEQKLKKLLNDHPQTDAALLITDLLVARHEEKIRTKEQFNTNKDIPEEDKW